MKPGGLILVHGGALGDFVLTLHQLQGLLNEFECPARVVCRHSYHCLLAAAPQVEAIDLDGPPARRLFGEQADAALHEIAAGLDGPLVVVDCLGTKLSSAQEIGFRLLRIDPREQPSENHILQQWTKQLAAQGLTVAPARPTWLRRAELRGDGTRHVIIHPGSGGKAKCWPLDHVCELIDHIRRDGWRVSVTLGPAELEAWQADAILQLEQSTSLITFERLDQFVELLQTVQFFVGNDSGPSHLAKALGCHTLVIFQSTNPNIWAPPGAQCVGPAYDGLPPSVDAVFNAWTDITRACNTSST